MKASVTRIETEQACVPGCDCAGPWPHPLRPSCPRVACYCDRMDVAILAFDGFTDIDVFLAWDLFNRVDTTPWKVAILADTPRVTSIAGLPIPAHGPLSDLPKAR